jgi:hypothetical protein
MFVKKLSVLIIHSCNNLAPPLFDLARACAIAAAVRRKIVTNVQKQSEDDVSSESDEKEKLLVRVLNHL